MRDVVTIAIIIIYIYTYIIWMKQLGLGVGLFRGVGRWLEGRARLRMLFHHSLLLVSCLVLSGVLVTFLFLCSFVFFFLLSCGRTGYVVWISQNSAKHARLDRQDPMLVPRTEADHDHVADARNAVTKLYRQAYRHPGRDHPLLFIESYRSGPCFSLSLSE